MTQGWALSVKVAKRELLLRAAREEFAELGLEGATMRGIAMRAGCSTGAIYPLFRQRKQSTLTCCSIAVGARCACRAAVRPRQDRKRKGWCGAARLLP